ncbi:pectinesterase inhibitor 9-like [Zingiber officinale]|uniref:Pectinesterase inhibitor domain-containing protein n=1 Tax=Zingiber officinale TaxID=94328 RepID=A0A8J5FIE9_ZINOF|nr:pectinesterase inhibitor 9-like [Zingiber officinale]KAG6486368.1 hypothetical protein ZIOFF_054938 [Zingiber officinale]
MAHVSVLSILLMVACVSASAGATSVDVSPTDFVRSSCGATRYRDLCFRCLAPYAAAVRRDPRRLARAAMSVSADRARSASAFVSQAVARAKWNGPRDAGAVRDCLENMADSVDRLRQSAKELDRVGRSGDRAASDFAMHMGNVRAWCSAALTDENTCLDSLSDRCSSSVRAAVRPKVVEVAQVTSNALALVNRLWPN